MAKAILVMNMPDDCMNCQLVDSEDEICLGAVTSDIPESEVWKYYCGDHYLHGKPKWCPLILKPEREDTRYMTEEQVIKGQQKDCFEGYELGHIDGWNDCLDILEGEE